MAGSSFHPGMRRNSSHCQIRDTVVPAPPFTLRPMADDDLRPVKALHLESWRRSYAGLMPSDFLKEPVEREMDTRWATLPADHDLALVAERSGTLAGFALVYATHAEGPLLESLHVAADHQGSGVGRQLMGRVARDLAARGHDRLWLEVIAGNRDARRIYARWGGVESWPFKDIVAGQEVSAVTVRWPSLQPLLALA